MEGALGVIWLDLGESRWTGNATLVKKLKQRKREGKAEASEPSVPEGTLLGMGEFRWVKLGKRFEAKPSGSRREHLSAGPQPQSRPRAEPCLGSPCFPLFLAKGLFWA